MPGDPAADSSLAVVGRARPHQARHASAPESGTGTGDATSRPGARGKRVLVPESRSVRSLRIGPSGEGSNLPTLGVGLWDRASLECSIQNVIVSTGWRVTLFSEPGFAGAVVDHTGAEREAALTIDEPALSLIVEPPVLAEAATVFERAHFGGRWKVLTPGRYRMDGLKLAVGGLGSLSLPAGWRAVLDFGSASGVASDASVPDFDAWNAGAPIQALEIEAPGCGRGNGKAWVRLIGDQSGLPLHVAAGPDASVQLGPPGVGTYFRIDPRDDGWFSLAGLTIARPSTLRSPSSRPATSTGTLAELSVASHEPGAALWAAPAPEERVLFRWVPLADGTVAIQSRATGLVLDVCGGGRTPGTAIVQWYPHLERNQRFDLAAAPSRA